MLMTLSGCNTEILTITTLENVHTVYKIWHITLFRSLQLYWRNTACFIEILHVSFSTLTSIWKTFCSDKCWVTLEVYKENKFTFSCKQSYRCTILTKIRNVLKNCSKTFEYQIPCTYVRQHSRCHTQADGDRKVTSTHAQLPTVTVPYRFLPKHRSYTNAVRWCNVPYGQKNIYRT
jgi:hypothetical protein